MTRLDGSGGPPISDLANTLRRDPVALAGALAEAGSDGALADQLGVARRTIIRWRQRLGVDPPISTTPHVAQRRRADGWVAAGATQADTAKLVAAHITSVGKWTVGQRGGSRPTPAVVHAIARAGLVPLLTDDGMILVPEGKCDAVADYLSGESSADVADRHGISQPTVLRWVRDAGGEVRNAHDDALRAAAVADYLGGDGSHVVADRHGTTAASVRRWVRDAGGEVRTRGEAGSGPPAHDDALRAAAVADYLGGDTSHVVADRHGTTAVSVLAWVRAAGGEVRSRGRKRRTI